MTHPQRLIELAAGIGCALEESAAEQLLAYLDAMLDENQRINLTAVREREEAVLFHALDSLAVGHADFGLQPQSCLDLGTGNGFPGVAVACLFPKAEVLLLDRTLKKLKAIERALAASGFNPERVRVQQLDAIEGPKHGLERAFDLVTARAVGEPRAIGLLARPMIDQGGHFLAWMSPEQKAERRHPKAYQRPQYVEYTLPAPANRQRVVARYGR